MFLKTHITCLLVSVSPSPLRAEEYPFENAAEVRARLHIDTAAKRPVDPMLPGPVLLDRQCPERSPSESSQPYRRPPLQSHPELPPGIQLERRHRAPPSLPENAAGKSRLQNSRPHRAVKHLRPASPVTRPTRQKQKQIRPDGIQQRPDNPVIQPCSPRAVAKNPWNPRIEPNRMTPRKAAKRG